MEETTQRPREFLLKLAVSAGIIDQANWEPHTQCILHTPGYQSEMITQCPSAAPAVRKEGLSILGHGQLALDIGRDAGTQGRRITGTQSCLAM